MKTIPSYLKKTVKNAPHAYAFCRINGKDHMLGIYGSEASRAKYDNLVSQYLTSGRSRVFGIDEGMTLADLVAQYGNWAKGWYVHRDGTPTGTHTNMRPIMKRLLGWYGDTLAQDFSPLLFRDVIGRLIDEGLNVRTVNDAIARIKHMYRWAVSRQLVPIETQQALLCVAGECEYRTKAKPRKDIRGVADEALQRTMTELPKVVRDMVRLQRCTGMRPGEVTKIRMEEINQLESIWIYCPKEHKTAHHSKQRIIPLNDLAQAILEPYIRERGFCFTTPEGNPYRSDSYRRAIHRACERLGIAKWSPNQIRHKVGEEVQSQTRDIQAVMAMLGHSRESTARRYAKQNTALAEITARQYTPSVVAVV